MLNGGRAAGKEFVREKKKKGGGQVPRAKLPVVCVTMSDENEVNHLTCAKHFVFFGEGGSQGKGRK